MEVLVTGATGFVGSRLSEILATREKAKVTGTGRNLDSLGADPEGFRGKVGDVSSLKYQPKLTIRTKSEHSKVHIEIEDNGPDIPDEIKDKILQPFFTTKKGAQGTGLGLSITNDIVKAHGGELTIDSKAGSTCFRVLLKKLV